PIMGGIVLHHGDIPEMRTGVREKLFNSENNGLVFISKCYLRN
ncbi:preprotein translocase, SecA subunit, partial [Streptococcus agalactiae H36B]